MLNAIPGLILLILIISALCALVANKLCALVLPEEPFPRALITVFVGLMTMFVGTPAILILVTNRYLIGLP